MKKVLAFVAVLAMSTGALFAQKSSYIVERNGNQKKVASLRLMNDKGDLYVRMQAGGEEEMVPRVSLRYAVVARPDVIDQLGKLLEEKKYEQAIEVGSKVYQEYKFLGWGDYAASVKAEAYLAQGKVDAAKAAVAEARQAPGGNMDSVHHASILIQLHEKQYDQVEATLKQLMASKEEKTAIFVFNTRGDLRYAQGQKREAVLEYLKSLLLFEGKKYSKERDYARSRAVAVMNELNDPRAAKIRDMK
ncbi:MAG: tetratricopeptide repeat protein [Victivallales bacterium]|nr:tetratricopeptide repeat protein [Victivallales bacterium]